MDCIALGINGLTKRHRDFTLDSVSFSIPRGTVVGFIGENGAGKSTTLKTILGLMTKDAGTISICGKLEENVDFATRNKIGVVFDGNNYPNKYTPKQLSSLLENVYISWDKEKYFSMLDKLSLPVNRRIKAFSKGMKAKLAIIVALSQSPDLLIMDEPTSGLDPVMRDDILNILLDFVRDEKHSILISSHITSDLEKIADYIVFIHNGKVIFNKSQNELKNQYGIMKCNAAQFEEIDKEDVLYYRKQSNKWDVLIADKDTVQKKYPNVQIVPADIDDIMLFYIKGERL
ncbi:MAG: ABC transporter ATP-binding protein [Turicibacter sp.]|nr:ABC transporter ATP-binding protein [Turicibacter sp.]